MIRLLVFVGLCMATTFARGLCDEVPKKDSDALPEFGSIGRAFFEDRPREEEKPRHRLPPVTGLSEETQKLLRKPAKVPKPIVRPHSENEKRFRAALARISDYDFEKVPLKDVYESLEKRFGVPIVVDWKRLTERDVPPDSPITLKQRYLTGRGALARLPGSWVFVNDVLRISCDDGFVTRCYDVADLVLTRDEQGLLRRNYPPLLRLVRENTNAFWESIDGGGGTIAVVDALDLCAIAVHQPLRVHREIEELLAQLRRMQHDAELDPSKHVAPKPTAMTAFERRAETALAKKLSIDFDKTPLREVVKQVEEKLAVSIMLDESLLKDIGLSPTAPVTFAAKDTPARAILTGLFEELNRAFIVDGMDTVLLTSDFAAEERRVRRIYDVSDLVLRRDNDGKVRRDFEQLGRMLESHTSGLWSRVEGAGGDWRALHTLRSNLLIVHQTQDVQREIRELLVMVRKFEHDLPESIGVDREATDTKQRKAIEERSLAGKCEARTLFQEERVACPQARFRRVPDAEIKRRALLDRRISVNFESTPISEVAEELGQKLGIDVDCFADKPDEKTVTLKLEKHRAADVLDIVAGLLRVDWNVGKDAISLVSSAYEGAAIDTRTYDVADLALTRDNQGRLAHNGAVLAEILDNQAKLGAADQKDWQRPFWNREVNPLETTRIRVLVVRDRLRGHWAIEDLLSQLRRLKHRDMTPSIPWIENQR